MRLHAIASGGSRTICGQFHYNVQMAATPEEVTCRACMRIAKQATGLVLGADRLLAPGNATPGQQGGDFHGAFQVGIKEPLVYASPDCIHFTKRRSV